MITINYELPENYYCVQNIILDGPFGGFAVRIMFNRARGSYTLGLPPKQGPRHAMGDRACHHSNIKGNVTYKPLVDSKGVVSLGSAWTPNPLVPGYFSGIPIWQCSEGSNGLAGSFTKVNGIYWTDIVTNVVCSVTADDTHVGITLSWHFQRTSTYSGSYNKSENREVYWRFTAKSAYPKSGNSDVSVPGTTVAKTPYNTGVLTGTRTLTLRKVGSAGTSKEVTQSAIDVPLWSNIGTLGGDIPPWPTNFKSEITLQTVEACKVVKLNMLAFGRDIKNLHEVADWVKGLTKVRRFGDVARSYLGSKYGAPLTVDDTVKLVNSLKALGRKTSWRGRSIARSRGSCSGPSTAFPGLSWLMQHNCKLYYQPVDGTWNAVHRGLSDYGLFPSSKNLWDFIPYSFTLDWIVNASDYFRTADARDYLHTVNVLGVVQADRCTLTVPGARIHPSLGGSVEFTYYSRTCSPTLSIDDPSFQISNPSNHMVEGGALILARSKF